MSVPLSFFIGFLFTALLLVISALLVFGAKTLYFSIKARFPEKKEVPSPPVSEKKETPPVKKRAPRTIRSIEINPDEIDRIYVKKIS